MCGSAAATFTQPLGRTSSVAGGWEALRSRPCSMLNGSWQSSIPPRSAWRASMARKSAYWPSSGATRDQCFAAVPMRFMREMGVPHEKVNVNGGAIAMGHPLGATGAMLVGTLLDELERHEPHVPPAWRPTGTVPDELVDALGVWHWGNTPFVFAMEGEELAARNARGDEKYRFTVVDGHVIGTSGYHAGETLHVDGGAHAGHW